MGNFKKTISAPASLPVDAASPCRNSAPTGHQIAGRPLQLHRQHPPRTCTVCVFWQREVLTTRQFQSAGESKALDVLAKEGLAHESPGSGFLSAPRRTLESAHPATSSKRYRRSRRHGHLQQPARPFHGAHQLAVSTAKATLPGSAARKAL